MPRTVIFDNDKIMQLRDKKLSYEQIGKLVGVSRQRVHQIVKQVQLSTSKVLDKDIDSNKI